MSTVEIEFHVEGEEEAIGFLDACQKALEPPNFTNALGEGAEVYVQGAKRRAPKRTGRLSGSIHKEQDSEKSFEVGPSDDLIPIYAAPQEFGAKGNPYMKFQIDGHFVQVRSIKPTPYMEPTYRQDTEKAFEAFKDALFRGFPG